MVHREDPVHSHDGQHDSAVLTCGAARKSCSRTSADHRDIFLVGVCHDRGNFLFIDSLDVELRRIDSVLRHLIAVIFLRDLLSDPDTALIGHGTDGIKISFCHFLIWVCHFLVLLPIPDQFREFRNDLIQVIHDTIVGNAEDLRLRIIVDRNDAAGVLHTGCKLDRAGYTAGDD